MGWRVHVNSLWGAWYGACGTALQGFLAAQGAQRCLALAALGWAPELHATLALTGAAALLLPLFLVAACFKVGNLANDGFKLGRHLAACSLDSGLPGGDRAGTLRSLWVHGGPTAPFLHVSIAFCLLLPRLLLEAKLIQTEALPRDQIWHTDLDLLVLHKDRLVVLSFMSNSSVMPTPVPLVDNVTHTPPLALTAEHLKGTDLGPMSAEFLNYALALLVYAVRYPAVFWHTNKPFGLLFSLQLLTNGLQSLLAYAGMCVLYKVEVIGAQEALPILPIPRNSDSPFLLNPLVTLALFVLSNVLVLASSLVLYLYGYGRFQSFLNSERDRHIIVRKRTQSWGWGYFTHCAALCVLLAIAVCNAPLLHDYTVVYRGSLDGAVLACVVGGILHLLLWVVLWLVLTVKHHWIFKLRVSLGGAPVRSARSIKLVTDVHLLSGSDSSSCTPLLVVGNGRTYTITDNSPKKAIMSVVQKVALERKSKSGQGSEDNDEQIYWLRPKPPSPKTSPDSDRLTWLNRKLGSSVKHKVTFDDSVSGSKKGKTLVTKSPKGINKGKKGQLSGVEPESEDDGDYATLRELPRIDNEENKLLDNESQQDDYSITNKNLSPESSPLLTPEPREENHIVPGPVSVTVHNASDQLQGPGTPRCIRRADSGMPHDELTPRSDSVSTESSGGSPPCGGNHSETSSGVHSNSSSENQQPRRSTSVDDLTTALEQSPRVQAAPWKSFSLQRNVQPPTNSVSSQPMYGFASANALPSSSSMAVVPDSIPIRGCPAVLLENASENTVVIRRKQSRPKTTDGNQSPVLKDEPFGRSTNMRMTSFTDTSDGGRSDLENFPSSSSTLPHYPTQPVATAAYPHCSTMPLPSSSTASGSSHGSNSTGSGSCNLFPRQHTTIPTHHNGVRLFGGPSPFVKRFPLYHHPGINGRPHVVLAPVGPLVTMQANSGVEITSHHTFPQVAPILKFGPQQHLHKQDRDSAHFSMASSGDSDQYLPHS